MGPDGKELPQDDQGKYIGTGSQKVEEIKSESTEDPLTDEAGNPIEAGTPEAMIRAVRDHFKDEEDTEILSVAIHKTETVLNLSGEAFRRS